MKEYIASFINPIGNFLLDMFLQIPMEVVFLLFMFLLVLLAVWVHSLPKQLPAAAERVQKSCLQDLRITAVIILSLQGLLYILFF